MIVAFFTFHTEKDDHSFRLLQNLGKCPRKFKVKKPKRKKEISYFIHVAWFWYGTEASLSIVDFDCFKYVQKYAHPV